MAFAVGMDILPLMWLEDFPSLKNNSVATFKDREVFSSPTWLPHLYPALLSEPEPRMRETNAQ